MVDAHLRVERGGEIFGPINVFRCVIAFGVGGADDLAAGNARASHENGHGAGPVIAAGIFVYFRGASEFAEADDHGFVHEAAGVKVGDEGGKALVELLAGFAFEGFEDFGVVIPAAAVNGDETDADFDKAAGEEEALAKIVSTVGFANFFGFLADVEGLLGVRGANELEGLGIIFVEGDGGIVGKFFVVALHAVEGTAKLLAGLGAAFADVLRENHVADFKAGAVWIAVDDEGGVLGAEEIRAAGAGDFGHGGVGGQAIAETAVKGNHGTEGGMEGDVGATRDGDGRGHAGHHVVVAAAVVRVFMANGADDGEFVEGACELRDAFGEMNARDVGGNGFEFAPNVGGGVGLGIEGFVVGRAAIQPNQNAINVFAFEARFGISRAEAKEIGNAEAEQPAEADLQKITTGVARAVGRDPAHTNASKCSIGSSFGELFASMLAAGINCFFRRQILNWD